MIVAGEKIYKKKAQPTIIHHSLLPDNQTIKLRYDGHDRLVPMDTHAPHPTPHHATRPNTNNYPLQSTICFFLCFAVPPPCTTQMDKLSIWCVDSLDRHATAIPPYKPATPRQPTPTAHALPFLSFYFEKIQFCKHPHRSFSCR